MKPVVLILVFMLAAGVVTFFVTRPDGTRYLPGDTIPAGEGVENVIVFSKSILSGSEPEGEAGLDALAALGVKSIVSVDAKRPDIELAEARGMRYVHVPLKYDGIDGPQRVAIAKALQDLPKPIFVHCHHGKHRGPAAAAIGLVCLGEIDADEAVDLMRTAGTSENYDGLYGDVGSAMKLGTNVIEAADMPPAHVEVTGLAATMVEVEHVFDELTLIADEAWQVPEDHPDLDLGNAASRLPDLLRALADELDQPANAHVDGEYRSLMHESARLAAMLETAIEAEDWTLADELRESVAQSCVRCHETHR